MSLLRYIFMMSFVMLTGLSTTAEEETGTVFLGTSQPAGLTVRMQSELDPLVLNQMHSWLLELSDARGAPVTGAIITMDGGMPAHDHGLPTRPQVSETPAPGQYRADGVRFHMGGEWRLNLQVEHEGRRFRFTFALTL